jgi:hypothetical protein
VLERRETSNVHFHREWLHDLLKAQETRLVVCAQRKAALFKNANNSDRIGA